MRNLSLALLAAALAIPAAAAAQPAKLANQCFFDRDWWGWKAIDNKSMYIRTGLHQVFRVDFATGCPGLTSPASHLVTSSHTGSVCSAIDLDVRVADQQGFSTPCIASGLTRLTEADMAAIPKKLVP